MSLAERFDVRLVEELRPFLLSRFGNTLGKLGNLADQPPLFVLSGTVAAAGVLAGNARLRRTGVEMILAHLISTIAKHAGKSSTSRSRPKEVLADGTYGWKSGGSEEHDLQSFPSGHTASSVALAVVATHRYPRMRPVAYGSAAVMGMLQVIRQAHFPTDVVAGAVIGIAAGRLSRRLMGDHDTGN